MNELNNTVDGTCTAIFHRSKCLLGEGLLYTSGALYWLDIQQAMLMVKKIDGQYFKYSLPECSSAIWKVNDDIVYLVSESGLCTYNLKDSSWDVLISLQRVKSRSEMRTNDGGWFSEDFYLFGTMQKQPIDFSGSLYSTDGYTVKKIYSNIGIPNLFVRLDCSHMLIADSLEKIIYKFEIDPINRGVVGKSVWLSLKDKDYAPDGGCIDGEGNIYVAMWDGYSIEKYDVRAKLVDRYVLPVPRPTNCVLSLDEQTLFVTTAREGLSVKLLQKYPDSGSVFKINLRS